MHHLLIGGIEISGKTGFIHNTIFQLTQKSRPEEIKLMTFDEIKIYHQNPPCAILSLRISNDTR